MAENDTPRPSPEEKARIEAAVAQCIEAIERGEADPSARICGDDARLLSQVQRRLAQLAARGLIPDSEMLPATIGPYRVRRVLGSGGMGHVYLADQLEPVRRQVALKVIKLGMDTREVVARFQAERQALARMNHPNIAQVFDAGITAEGRPYFVMEYVAGPMLTTFCDQRTLPTEARIRLLTTICRAVQHAHDRGFIHRDLKPSNILVAAEEGAFVPKVIDFGIAKATAAAAEAAATDVASLHTRADQLLGTPEYMSPEQMRSAGIDIDTRSDVYSLGVTLYELLCGELPFDSRRLRSVGRGELERILQNELPTQPSKRLSVVEGAVVSARGGERATVQRQVAGELDWITLKALAKQREQRYPSALALAEDLERWLRHEPVLAAPPGRAYRLRKFVRRHRVAVGAGVAVVLSLVTALGVSLQATSAARAAQVRESAALDDMRAFFGMARDAVGNLVDVANQRLAEVPQAEPVRRELLAYAMDFYELLRVRQPADPGLQRERVVAILRIGQLQRQLGQPNEALATFRQCLAAVTAMREARPDDPHAAMLFVNATNQLATTLTSLGHGAEARAELSKALAALAAAKQLPGGVIQDVEAQEARLLNNFAIEHTEDPTTAIALFERSLAAFDRAPNPTAQDLRDRARAAVEYSQALTRCNRLGDAADTLAKALTHLQALPGNASVPAREEEATLQDHLATVLRRLDRRDEARAALRRSIDLYTTLATEHPDIPTHGDQAAAGWHSLAQIEAEEAELAVALESITKATTAREALVARFPQHVRLAMHCASSLLARTDIETQLWQQHGGERDAPERTLTRAVKLVDELQRNHPDDLGVLITFGGVHGAMGALCTTRSEFAEAVRQHELVRDAAAAQLATAETNADLHYQVAMAGSNLLQAHFLLGQPAAALAAGEAGLRHLERGLALDARHPALRDLADTLLGRIATARFATDDLEGGIATLQSMCARTDWGPDVREQGCLLLSQQLRNLTDHPQRRAWLERAAVDLRSLIAARGSLEAALRRPPQQTGFSRLGSRLRDFDLRLALADIVGELQQTDGTDERDRLLAEGSEIDRSMPGISADRVRNLFTQQAEQALAKGDAAAAETAADTLLARAGEHGGANYLVAVLLARTMTLAAAADRQTQLGAEAVVCLARAIADGEVPAAAARHANFTSLRGRPDYEALIEQ